MQTEKILIIGANGNIGKKMLLRLKDYSVRALVRSEHAMHKLKAFVGQQQLSKLEIVQCDYSDLDQMSVAMNGCNYVVQLVGVIKESRDNSFYAVHEKTTNVLCQVLASHKVRRVLYLSLLGSDEAAKNACLASRGRAEKMLLQASSEVLIVRIPMVLGDGDYAVQALRQQAFKRFSFSFRAASLEQPIYAGDVLQAVTVDIERCFNGIQSTQGIVELAGPESLSRVHLRQRATQVLGGCGKTLSVPLVIGYLVAGLLQRVMANPPMTYAMLGVLNHDDNIDPTPAVEALGIKLTSLDEMLEKTLVL